MGHDHIQSKETLENTSYITLDALLDGFSQASYLELIINNQSANDKFVNL